MDPRLNPHAPGAGIPPPELAGRDALIEEASIALDRIRKGLAAKGMLMVGLRGVGKTVLLNRICDDARFRGFTTLLLEAPEDRSLPVLLIPPLHAALVRMNRIDAASDTARRALRALAGFVSAIKVGAGDLNVSLDLAPLTATPPSPCRCSTPTCAASCRSPSGEAPTRRAGQHCGRPYTSRPSRVWFALLWSSDLVSERGLSVHLPKLRFHF